MARGDSDEIDDLLRRAGLDGPAVDRRRAARAAAKIRALSLAIAQKCNLGCAYCYAEQGEFGAAPKNMSMADALRAVELLVEGAEPGARLNLAFLGGEPLVNRPTLREAARRARDLAESRGAKISFSITTNGTLLTEDDARFFEDYGFAVTISLDGPRELHDALRPFKGGRGSFDAIMRRVEPLLRLQRAMQVTARVTVTPSNLSLRRTLDDFIAAGFHSVGFSPMLSAPDRTGRDATGPPRTDARRDDRLRARVRAARPSRPALSFRQHGQRHAGDPPRHAPTLPLRGGRRLSRRVGGRRTFRLPPLCRRLRRARWARSPTGSTGRARRSGSPSGMFTGRSHAGPAGRAISAAAAAITR